MRKQFGIELLLTDLAYLSKNSRRLLVRRKSWSQSQNQLINRHLEINPTENDKVHWARIRVWRSNGTTNYGHASIETSSGEYLSHWPKEKSGLLGNTESVFSKSVQGDIKAYNGKHPDFVAVVKLTSKQLENIDRYINYRKEVFETWSGLNNCTDAVVKALKAGGVSNYKLKFNRSGKDIISTPIELIEKIKEDIDSGKVNYKIERDKNQHLNKEPKNIRRISEKDTDQSDTQRLSAEEVAKNVHKRIAEQERRRLAQLDKERSTEEEISVG